VRDIDNISSVVDELRSSLPEVERRFNAENDRFKELLKADHDQIGRVLKCHLIVEVYLNRYLTSRFPALRWDEAELRFAQKLSMLPLDDLRTQFIAPGLSELNRIRNRFGHRLQASIVLSDLPECTKALAIARRGKTYIEPLEVIEDFATVASTWLIVDPVVEKIFNEAFRRAAEKAAH
jgi:hypothetical protein